MKIVLKNICFNYETDTEIRVFEDISCEIEQGELIGITGKTGSGKSTFLQLCTGFLSPLSGSIRINDSVIKNTKDWSDFRNRIGLVFQFPEKQLFEETVFSDIAFGMEHHNNNAEDIKTLVNKALLNVGLAAEEFSCRSPLHLSSGERRKVALAGVTVHDPDFLFLDEPTIGLDKRGIDDIENLLTGINQKGKTVCVVSHNIDFLFRLCNRIIVFGERMIQYDGSKKDMFVNSDDKYSYHIEKPEIIVLCESISRRYNIPLNGIYNIEDLSQSISKISNFQGNIVEGN